MKSIKQVHCSRPRRGQASALPASTSSRPMSMTVAPVGLTLGFNSDRRQCSSKTPSSSTLRPTQIRHRSSSSTKTNILTSSSPMFQLTSSRCTAVPAKYKPPTFQSSGLRLLSSTSTSLSTLSGGVSEPTSGRPGMGSEADLGRHFYLNKVLEQWAAKPATRMTLRQLIFFGRTLGRDREKILKSANYVRNELPVRIAHRIRDLQALPFVVMTNQHLEEVYQKYWSAFETFRRFPYIKSMDDNERWCNLLRRLLDDHLTIIPSLTIGIVESSHHLHPQQLDKFMERMLRSRISRRVLAEQHIALSEALDDPFHFFNEPTPFTSGGHSSNQESGGRSGSNNDHDLDRDGDNGVGDHVGIIYTKLSVLSVVNKGIKLLTKMFQEAHGIEPSRMPAIEVDGDLKARFAYIPEHLEYIVFELLKNAIRATIRNHQDKTEVGKVRITIVEGPPEEDLIIRISDSGGGLPDLISQLTSRPSGMFRANAPSGNVQLQQHGQVSPANADGNNDPSFANGVESTAAEQPYPIPFPDMGHIGGYPPRGSRARLLQDSSHIPVTLQGDTSPSNQQASFEYDYGTTSSYFAEPWAGLPQQQFSAQQQQQHYQPTGDSTSPGNSSRAAIGGVGSAGGVGGSFVPPNEFGTVGTSTTYNFGNTMGSGIGGGGVTGVGGAGGGYSDPLIDALCSFSNVRKRLELEEQRDRMQQGVRSSSSSSSSSPSKFSGRGSPTQESFYNLPGFPDRPHLVGGSHHSNNNLQTGFSPLQTESGLGTRDRFLNLKSIGKFKGVVDEQLNSSGGMGSFASTPSSSTNQRKSEASMGSDTSVATGASNSAGESGALNTGADPSLTAGSGGTENPTSASISSSTEPILKMETGLGLPMTKVYCDFFGGSLSFRSLDGHSTDIYVRLPKLGTNKETIEEIVL